MNKNKLIQEQLDRRIIRFNQLEDMTIPSRGWIYSIRKGINMTLRQLGSRLSITPQSVREIEEREMNGTVSLQVLRQVATALDMKLVYGFLPRDKSLENMVKMKAAEKAKEIVERTSVQMSLEDQKVSEERLQRAILEKASELERDLPKFLWD